MKENQQKGANDPNVSRGTVQIEALEHKDIKGKKTYYLKVWNEKKEYFINVGKTTFETVKEITDEIKPNMGDNSQPH